MRLLNRMPIRYKLYILVALTALALAGAVGFSVNILYGRMLNDRIDKMRAATDIAASYAQLLEDQVKTGKVTRAEAMVRFREAGHAMRYDGEGGYVFATNLDGMVVLHPHTQFEGTTGPVDASGRPIMPMLIAALQAADSATIRYTFAKPQGGEALPKLTYIRMFAPWKIIIASGMWIDDIDADMRAALLQLGIAGLGMITLIALMAFFLSRNITVPLGCSEGQNAAARRRRSVGRGAGRRQERRDRLDDPRCAGVPRERPGDAPYGARESEHWRSRTSSSASRGCYSLAQDLEDACRRHCHRGGRRRATLAGDGRRR